jgi:hypothetical protein
MSSVKCRVPDPTSYRWYDVYEYFLDGVAGNTDFSSQHSSRNPEKKIQPTVPSIGTPGTWREYWSTGVPGTSV